MQYHAAALAVNDVAVDLVGLAGTPVAPWIAAEPRITCHAVGNDAAAGGAGGIRRALALTFPLASRLARLPAPDLVLLQVPPALPLGILGWMVARMRGARFVVDWHNLGWTLLAHQRRHGALVATLRAVERWIARRGDAHLCVSRAMREHLADRWNVDAAVCYDRPPDGIAAAPAARDAMRARLLQEAGVEGTPAAILISPTSWTADESTDLLFDTADALDAQAPALPRDFPRIVLLATGRGPGRAAFDARAARRRPGPAATVRSDWVAPASYPALLAAADGGVSLHQSSSGLDLPMKIADMFGAGLPVLALSYPALAERLRDGENGCLFTDAASLARRIVELWSPGSPVLDRLRAGSRASGRDRWLEGWMAEAAPTLL